MVIETNLVLPETQHVLRGQNLLIKGCWSDFVSLNISTYIIGFTACSSSKQNFKPPATYTPSYNVDVYCCTTDNCNFPTTQNTSDAFDCHQVHNNIRLLNPDFTNYGDRNESCPAGDTTCVTLNGTYSGQNLLVKGCWTDFVSLNISTYIIGFTACSSSKQTFQHPASKPPYNVDVYCCTTDNCNFPTTQNNCTQDNCTQDNLSTSLIANLLLIIVSVTLQIVNNVNTC
uniref:UPAR/Ly6 domain-containing protein n=1 Tax=Acrobeloides nanus TaxID=290746 RepID=A0A914DRE6_9BILA